MSAQGLAVIRNSALAGECDKTRQASVPFFFFLAYPFLYFISAFENNFKDLVNSILYLKTDSVVIVVFNHLGKVSFKKVANINIFIFSWLFVLDILK